MTIEDFFVALLGHMKIGGVSKKKHTLYTHNQNLRDTDPVLYIIFLELKDCWNFLGSRYADPEWRKKTIRSGYAWYIRKRVFRLLGQRMRQALIEKDNHEFIAGAFHLEQAEQALQRFIESYSDVCIRNNIRYWPKVDIDSIFP